MRQVIFILIPLLFLVSVVAVVLMIHKNVPPCQSGVCGAVSPDSEAAIQ